MQNKINRGTGKAILLPILLAFLLAVPAFIIGQDGEADIEPMQSEYPDLPPEIDLSYSTMEQYIGGDFAFDSLGYATAKGDFNMDGIEDIVASAPGFNGTRGGIFMFFGGDITRVMSYNDANVMIDNGEMNSYFGLRLKVGDVDNDGRDDLLVGGYADPIMIPDLNVEDRSFLEYPKVYLFLGKDGWAPRMSSSNADSVFIGTSKEHLFGWDIELGDVTGDGYDDVLISEVDPWSPFAGGGGGGGGPVDLDTNIALDATASHSGGGSGVWGPDRLNNGDTTGSSNDCWTSAGGWVQLEWEEEVWIGAMKIWYTRWRNLAATYCLHRCTVQWWDGDDWQDDQDYDDGSYSTNNDHFIEMTSPVKTTKLRLYQMWAGSNVMIQEWEVFPAQASTSPYVPSPEGRVYVFDGSDSMQSVYNVSLGNLGGYSHLITNSVNTTGLANTDLGIGDINGDGYQDMLIGSGGIQYSGLYAGGVQVVFGGSDLPETIDLFTHSHVNITSFENFRLSKVAVADINGDGIDDLITCAPMGFFDLRGGIFIFYGDTLLPTGERSILDYDLMVRGPYSEVDLNAKGLPDLDGDGKDELMVYSHNGMDEDGKGCYWIIYSSSLENLDNDVYYMHLQDQDVVIKGESKDRLFAHSVLDNFMFVDFNGDGKNELITSLPLGSYGDNPPESGMLYIFYEDRSEIQVKEFMIHDADGSEGNILGAGKVYHLTGYVKDTWDLNDIRSIEIKLVLHGGAMEGRIIQFFWDRGLMVLGERSDPDDFVTIESSAFNPDGDNGMWIYFNLSFSQNIPTEEFMDLIVDVEGGIDMALSLSYPSIFKVEPDVDFAGEFQVVGEFNGVLSKGAYVRPNEKIEVRGLKAVFEGTDASPPNDYFGIKMTDNIGNVFLNTSSSGREIYFTYRTQEIAGREEINLTFVDLSGEADNSAGVLNFFYLVDIDVPEPPEEILIRADSDIDTLFGYDNDPEVFITWNPSFDPTSEVIGYMYSNVDGGGTDQGTFTENTQIVYDDLKEGWNDIYVWSVDAAHNFGPSQVASVYYDTEMPTFGIPNPGPGAWVNSNTVNYEMIINDEDGSGVRGSTVEYAISFDGGRTFSAWEPTNIRNEGEQIRVRVFLNFREGDENFIRWRAKDISGNGYIVSDPFQVKVDTVPLSYKSPVPAEPVAEDYIECGITLTDIGAGVDASTIQYAISYDGVSNYGPWETLDLSGFHDSIEVSTPPIYFEKGTLNYIKWRSMDGAKNGYTYSEDLPIDVLPQSINRYPVPVISNPREQVKYLESQMIMFDGSSSIDADGDEMKYLWYSDKDGYLSTDPIFEDRLSQANHLITLHVDDGLENRSISIEVSVIPDPTAIDTDEDGIPDFNDDDDDNDKLLDIQEDINKNGLIDYDLNETDPKNPDTDGDGFNDYLDARPLNPDVQEAKDESNLPLWIAIVVFVVIILAFIVAGLLFVMKQRSDKKGMDARRKLRRTRRNVRRFEVLTGVPTNDLPAIEAVQWALPGVINEASGFMLEPVPSDDLLPPSPDDDVEEEGHEDSPRPDLQDYEVPEPASAPVEPDIGDEVVPGPEAPEPEGSPMGGGSVVNCSLCGSEVPVPEGASQVECPLCGEINNF